MRVCGAHKERAVMSLIDKHDTAMEFDFCPECVEVFQLLVSGEFFNVKRPGRPKRLEAVAPEG